MKCRVTDTEERTVTVDIPSDGFPDQIFPEGLPIDRQQYLYNEIREFCRPGTEDLVCPKPSTQLPSNKKKP